MRKAAILYTANVLLFMGSLWQLEIADLCLTNGWSFRFLFNTITLNDIWAVRDFWMGLLLVTFLLNSAVALYLWVTRRGELK